MAKTKLERLFDLCDEDSYSEYQKLTPSEKREFDILAMKRAEHFKQLTRESHEQIKELEEKIKQKDEEYERLKRLH